jgi:hypothetical protein
VQRVVGGVATVWVDDVCISSARMRCEAMFGIIRWAILALIRCFLMIVLASNVDILHEYGTTM